MSSLNKVQLIEQLIRERANKMSIGDNTHYGQWQAHTTARLAPIMAKLATIDREKNPERFLEALRELAEVMGEAKLNLNDRNRAISPYHNDRRLEYMLEKEQMIEQIDKMRAELKDNNESSSIIDTLKQNPYFGFLFQQQDQNNAPIQLLIKMVQSLFGGGLPDWFKHVINKA